MSTNVYSMTDDLDLLSQIRKQRRPEDQSAPDPFAASAGRTAPPAQPSVYMAPSPPQDVPGGATSGGGSTTAPPPFTPPKTPATEPPKITPGGPTDGGWTTPANPPKIEEPQPSGWSYQGEGFQAPARGEVQPFQRQAFEVPPPPPPPAAPPPSADFLGMTGTLGAAQRGPQYQTAAGSYVGENLSPDLEQYARDAMANPNRYTTPWMQSALAAINGQIDLSRSQGQRELAELMARRGTLGSTIEQQGAVNLEAQLDQTRLAQLSDLLQNMATVNAQDRTAAANIGLGVGQFEQGLGNDRRAEGQFQYSADRQAARDLEADRQARVNANLQAGSLQNQADLDRFQAAMDAQKFVEGTRMDTANLGLQSQDLDLRAYQIQQDAISRGQQLDLDTAKAMAESEMERNQMSQQESQYQRALQEQQAERAVQERLAQQQEEHQQFIDGLALYQLLKDGLDVREGDTYTDDRGRKHTYHNGQWVDAE